MHNRPPGASLWDLKDKKRHGMWFHEAKPLLQFLTDSSKELEELRSAFTRALEYLKQEVEERKCGFDPFPFPLVSCSWWVCLLSQRLRASKLISDFD